MKTCKTCLWWEPFQGVCFNGDSEHCADFVDNGCECYDERSDEQCD